MSVPSDIVEKVKKLLRLARSANPHEAQLALQRALELAREHGIAVGGLNPDEQAKEKTVTHRDTDPAQRLSYDSRYAAMVCQRFFNVATVERAKIAFSDGWPRRVVYLMFVGSSSDLEIALYVYGFLKHHFAFCWRKHRGRLRNRQAFVYGMFQGVFANLLESKPPVEPVEAKGTELAIDARRNYIVAVVGKTTARDFRPPGNDARAATWAGFLHGQKTSIRNALKESERTGPLALI